MKEVKNSFLYIKESSTVHDLTLLLLSYIRILETPNMKNLVVCHVEARKVTASEGGFNIYIDLGLPKTK